MQSGFTAHIAKSEWRWVIFVSVALVLLAYAPYAVLVLSGVSGSEWQFMGILHNSRDGATYLSKMMLGAEGEWLVHFQHTPEPHDGAFIQVIYPLLGQLAGLVGAPVGVVFHIIRLVASVFMYMALYQLAATIWMKIRTRRLFFVLVSVGAGFGWLYALLSGGAVDAPDLSIPEAFPLQSTFVNVHFPLAISCLALLLSVIIAVFRPGTDGEPTVSNGGLLAAALSFALGLLYPQALVPLGGAVLVYVALLGFSRQRIPRREVLWVLTVILPVLPLAAYYGAVVMYNPAMAQWNQQNVTPAPPPVVMLIGFGLPLLLALPGIVHAVRRFSEGHDDRFMLIWLILIVIMIYLPTNIQRRFAVGMMLPVAYFATRALESFWFQHVTSRRWQYRLFVLLLPLMLLTPFFALFVPTMNQPQDAQGLFLERDYIAAFDWLQSRTGLDDVILASEFVSQWIPGWVGARVVYGHPYETLQAATKKAQVEAWYQGDCDDVIEQYHVKYILFGPEEAKAGRTPCLEALQPVVRSGEVFIYAP